MKLTKMVKWLVVFSVIMLSEYCRLISASICNEAVCASVVSKCMLTQSCKCDLQHCTCCKDCVTCLSYLYDECCACVDMCPGPSVGSIVLSRHSYANEINDSIPALFAALTDSPDPMDRWRTVSIPIAVSDLSLQSVEEPTTNCTVAYFSQCMAYKKCKANCETMGSAGFRWFHDGCCECIGETCKNFGLDESRCLACSERDSMFEEKPQGELDYAEDFDPQDADELSQSNNEEEKLMKA